MLRYLALVALVCWCQGFDYPFQNPDLSWDERVDDLVNRLTLEEIVAQTMAVYGDTIPGIPRLGLKNYTWITECLRGEVNTNTTAFPQSLGLAAAFRYPGLDVPSAPLPVF